VRSPYYLRDRATLNRPIRYQANMADCLEVEPTTYAEAAASPHWIESMRDEYQSHVNNKTWTLVARPTGTKVLEYKWVYKIKRNPDHSVARYKSRLVIRGFRQQYGVDYFETFASVSRY
jgi:hypothetical protein